MKATKRTMFVRNESPAAMQSLTCNVLPKLVRHDTMEGRSFLVVPMVILTEGVHKGSGGALYYSPEELAKTPAAWNAKPVVVYHPEMNGQAVSACDPSILTNRKVGVMMNTVYEKGKLKSEAWLEKDRADKVDERIMAAVESGEMMELSTGVFVDCEESEGEWKGEKYMGLARNFRPDHLALLPDKIGACSISDGAGFLRNELKDGKKSTIAAIFQSVLRSLGMSTNEMSQSNTRDALGEALRAKLGIKSDMNYNGPYCYVEDVYSDFVVYSYDGKIYRIGYTASETGVELSDLKPVEVVRVTEYRTVAGAYVGNQDQTPKERTMDKKQLVDGIIGNGSGWSEEDRPTLMAMSEAQLKKIKPVAAPVANAAPTNVVALPVQAAAAPVAAQPAVVKVVSLEEYVGQAPKEIRDVLTNSVQAMNEEKARLVEAILANKSHGFTKEDLSARPLNELRNIAALAAPAHQAAQTRTANYGGQADVPTGNEAEEPMLAPVMNFDKAAK